ncbi:MAG: hypothetical protein HOP21_07105 [Methylotenera sp.]|nr:hypothetical protein [Methylotenera sp.]
MKKKANSAENMLFERDNVAQKVLTEHVGKFGHSLAGSVAALSLTQLFKDGLIIVDNISWCVIGLVVAFVIYWIASTIVFIRTTAHG